jgi:PhnB protein
MIVKPTLHFNGQCAEAIALYQEAFGCEVQTLLHTNGNPAQRVMHSEIALGNIIVRMSDGLTEDNHPAAFPLFMSLNFETAEEVLRAAEVIEKAGGTVIEPFESYPFSPCMGSIVDPYGFRWRLMVE